MALNTKKFNGVVVGSDQVVTNNDSSEHNSKINIETVAGFG